MTFALIAVTVIVALSAFIGYLFFSILNSSAEASLQNAKLSGAFAGFFITASLLSTLTFQFYKQITADQITKYRDQIQELQTKLVKGAPCPEGYTIEVDEKRKIVFSRPEEWLPKLGILYQFVEKNPLGMFAANFNVFFQGLTDLPDIYRQYKLGDFDPDKFEADKVYDDLVIASVADAKAYIQNSGLPYENEALTKEYIDVDSIKSIKATLAYTTVLDPAKAATKLGIIQCFVVTYVPNMKGTFLFTFSDNEEDYLKSSEVFNKVISSIRFLP